MIEIKNRWDGKVIFRSEVATTIREAIGEAIEKARAERGPDARANLADANLAGAYLADADLAGANLAGADLADADLADANLAGANLAGADLAGADLAGADLARAYLAGAYLAGAYLAGARRVPEGTEHVDPPEPYVRAVDAAGYAKRAERFRAKHPNVPVVERLDQKMLEHIDNGSLQLEMSSWHSESCGTTHCRAGMAITLAGEAGAALEKEHGPQHAGRMIYLASTGRAPHFFATNERALEDIRRCAAEQVAAEASPA